MSVTSSHKRVVSTREDLLRPFFDVRNFFFRLNVRVALIPTIDREPKYLSRQLITVL
jgi:hypothetical protein